MHRVLTLGALLFLVDLAAARCAQAGEKPPFSFARVGGEISTGLVGGLVGAILPCVLLSSGTHEDWGGMFAMFCIVPVTYPVCSVVGVYLIGRIGSETGSFLATLGGSVLGGIIGMIAAVWSFDHVDDWSIPIFYACFLAAPIGATVGFNLTRKYK